VTPLPKLTRASIVALGAAGLILITLSSLWLAAGREPARADRHETPVGVGASRARDTLEAEVPAKAWHVLAEIRRRDGDPPPGYVGGRTFQNRERQLPPGSYREYDVEPRRSGQSRGPERIVIEERSGLAYYTGDHYVTFVPMP
jgi:guanyl-specific ribonuclease Sa